MPAYFEKHGLHEPTGQRNTVFATAMGQPYALVWDLMAQDKERMVNFQITMRSTAKEYPFLGSYDLSWAAEAAFAPGNTDRDIFVDIGGSDGHAILAVAKSAGLPLARCVLEDLPAVIEVAKSKGGAWLEEVKLVGMDFRQDQPIKGAEEYSCLQSSSVANHSYSRCIGLLRPPLPPRLL